MSRLSLSKTGKLMIASVALIGTLVLSACTTGAPQPNPSGSPSATIQATDAPNPGDVTCDAEQMEQDQIDATDAVNDAKADLRDAEGSGAKKDAREVLDQKQTALDTIEAAIALCQNTDWLNDVRDQMTSPGHFTYFCEENDLGLLDLVIYAGPEYGPGSNANPKRLDTLNPSIPLTGDTAEQLRDNFFEHLCTDPFLGLLWGYVVGNLEIDGLKVFDVEGNELLKLADVTLQKINNLAQTFILEEGATDDEVQTFTENNDEYRAYAQTLIAILQQWKLLGIEALTSEHNWQLEGPSAGIANAVENPDQENLPAVLFGVTKKGQCEPEVLIGVNPKDGRPEVFNPSDLPFCQFNPPPPPKVGCEPNCGGNPGCEPNCHPECPDGVCKGTNAPSSGSDDGTQDDGKDKEPKAPAPTTPPAPPKPDLCPNLPGYQPSIPAGYDANCQLIPPPPNEGGDN